MASAAIIGAGPAGSMAGILLARRGIAVDLVEQRRFPRHKVCGECISAVGVDVLRATGLLGRLCAAGAVEISDFAVHAGSGRSVQLELPRAMLGLSRYALDEILLEAAREAGAVVWQPARCERLKPRVVVRELVSNRLRELEPDVVMLADGKGAGPGGCAAATGEFAVKAHFEHVELPRSAVHLFGCDGHYGGLAPIENGMWNLAMLVPAQRLAGGRDLDEFLKEIGRENVSLGAALHTARRVTPFCTCPLPRYGLRRNWPANVIPIGNAAAAIEPIGGEGIGLALASAAAASHAVGDAITQGQATIAADEIRKNYRRLWRWRAVSCRMAAIAVAHPSWCSAAVRIMKSAGVAREIVLRLTGKADVRAQLHIPHIL